MKKRIQIVPAILTKTKEDLVDTLKMLEPYVERAQIDIIDGLFANNRTNDDLSRIKTKLKLEVHLMVVDPLGYIEKYKNVAWMITLHYESFEEEEDLLKAISLVKKYKMKVGLAVGPLTSIYRIQDFVKKVDQILIMSVRPGFGGQNFIDTTFGRVSTIRALNPNIDVEVDGGVRLSLVKDIIASGANIIVAGKAITHHYDVELAINNFKSEVKKALVEL